MDYPHIHDLMFVDIDLDFSVYPDLNALSEAPFGGVIEALKYRMPDQSEEDVMIKAINIWASAHGLVNFLRRSDGLWNKNETLKWIENNLEEYLEMTTFQ